MIRNIEAVIIAVDFVIAPEGSGLFFLTGCARSDSISTRSFITYIALDARQKIRNANNVVIK
jgi:hypothetical protein